MPTALRVPRSLKYKLRFPNLTIHKTKSLTRSSGAETGTQRFVNIYTRGGLLWQSSCIINKLRKKMTALPKQYELFYSLEDDFHLPSMSG